MTFCEINFVNYGISLITHTYIGPIIIDYFSTEAPTLSPMTSFIVADVVLKGFKFSLSNSILKSANFKQKHVFLQFFVIFGVF
jgi:hypothetical protein